MADDVRSAASEGRPVPAEARSAGAVAGRPHERSDQERSYRLKHPVRLVTAAALFDGHDASINIMRRILQASGAEVIHLGHNRSVDEIVSAALDEDVQGIEIGRAHV